MSQVSGGDLGDGELWRIIRRVCTAKEIEVMRALAKGSTLVDQSRRTGFSYEEIRRRYRNARRKIERELAAMGVVDP